MGAASKIVSVVFRLGELVSACIVAGLVGQFLNRLGYAHVHADSRIIYTEVLAGLSIAFSIIFLPPFLHSFYAFPLDIIMFIMWMVCFGLLANLTVSGTCSSSWYYNYWGWYWGGFWRRVPGPIVTTVGTVGCRQWRTVLAFSFIGSFCWLANFFVGFYVIASRKDKHSQVSPDSIRKDERETQQTPMQTQSV